MRRVLKYDVIRIVAILMVLMIHCTTALVIETPDHGSFTFLLANIINGLGRAGVPMFLMLTGALLLNEEKTFDAKKFYKGAFLKIVFLLVFWVLVYASWRALLLPSLGIETTYPTVTFVEYILTLHGYYPSLWYMYMLVGVYLAIPFLRLFVKKENKNYILGFILLALAAQFLTQTLGVFTENAEYITIPDYVGKFHLEYATGFLPYVLIGWYLTNFPPKKTSRMLLYLCGLASLVGAIAAVAMRFSSQPTIHDYVMEAFTFPAAVYGMAMFTLISALFKDRKSESKVVHELSGSAFGVYIIHAFILDLLVNKLFCFSGNWTSMPALYILLLYLMTYAICLGIVLSISRVKGVKKIFHY